MKCFANSNFSDMMCRSTPAQLVNEFSYSLLQFLNIRNHEVFEKMKYNFTIPTRNHRKLESILGYHSHTIPKNLYFCVELVLRYRESFVIKLKIICTTIFWCQSNIC